MEKKYLAFTIVIILLLTGVPVVLSEQPEVTKTNVQQGSINQTKDSIPSEAMINDLLDSLTINDLVTLIRQQLTDNGLRHSSLKTKLLSSLDQGILSLNQEGVPSTLSLSMAQKILGNDKTTTKTKYRPFLLGILPIQTTVSTLIPPVSINLTSMQTAIGNVSVKFEVFVKVVPYFDRVVTRQLGIRGRLTESSILWPTVGGRLTVAGYTVCM